MAKLIGPISRGAEWQQHGQGGFGAIGGGCQGIQPQDGDTPEGADFLGLLFIRTQWSTEQEFAHGETAFQGVFLPGHHQP
jgi:hypothetical protein